MKKTRLFHAYATYISKALEKAEYQKIFTALKNIQIEGIFEYFDAKFNPSLQNENAESILKEKFRSALDKTENEYALMILHMINYTTRTNFYKKSGEDYCVVKIDSKRARGDETSLIFETIIFADHMEGIHMRGARVSRGGIRWSTRHMDYPAEVFGLVTAQIQKNAAIIPLGAKGAFIVRNGDKSQDAGIKAYDTFIRGLLEITDNIDIKNSTVIHPENLRYYDGEDTYIVAAADRGTATFSDYANDISKKYNFWLGDAFASGGSNGYDHKKIGITSLGTLEATKHHFENLGIHIDFSIPYLEISNSQNINKSEIISVIGVGGMSGDVFGNAMIFLGKIKLIAAFSHSHIFIDPTPDIEKSTNERKRLFANCLSWKDYDKSIISEGGGVFEISDNEIAISNQMKEALNIPNEVKKCSGPELIKHCLCAKIDLLFFGGIGTFVKGANEMHKEIKDSERDSMRVNGSDLSARVISEGANLAMSTAARIEFAQSGGAINTDALDNFSGVNCSDHEVNLKILLRSLDFELRNTILREIEPEVVKMILKSNRDRNMAILLDLFLSNTAEYQFLMSELGILQHNHQDHSSHERIAISTNGMILDCNMKNNSHYESQNQSCSGGHLTRPEIIDITSKAQIKMTQEMLKENIFANQFMEEYTMCYFPKIIQEKYEDLIMSHPLKKEIAVSVLTNKIIASIGAAFAFDLADKAGTSLFDSLLLIAFVESELHFMERKINLNKELLNCKQNQSCNSALAKIKSFHEELLKICEDLRNQQSITDKKISLYRNANEILRFFE